MLTRHKPSCLSSVVIALLLGGCGGGGTPSSPPVVTRYAYVVDTFGAISSYAFDAASGRLRHNGYVLSPAPTDGNVLAPATAPSMAPPMVVSSPTVLHLLARTSTAAPTIVAATIDGPTGILTPRSLTWATIPLDIVGHPSGKFLYVLDAPQNIQAAAVDATGNLSPVGAPVSMTGVGAVNRIAVDPQGRFLIASARGGAFPNFIDQVGTLAINATTGAPTGSWRRLTLPFQPGAVAVHPGGLCGVAIPQVQAAQLASFAISSSGVPSGVTSATPPNAPVDVAFNPQGTALIALGTTSMTAFPVTDAATCALGAPVAPVTTGFAGSNGRLSIDPTGRFAYASDPRFNIISAIAIGASPLSLTDAGASTAKLGLSGFAPVFTTGVIGVSYLPLYLYSTNTATNDISIFSIGSSAGGLTAAGSRTSLGTAPMAIAVDPWSRFAYVANRDSNNVAAFTINRSTGALSATSPPTTTLAKPVAVVVDPSGRFLFVAANGAARVQVFLINQATGALTASLPNLATLAQPTALAVDPTGSTLHVATIGGVPRITSFIINQTGGAPLGAVTVGASPTSSVGGSTGLAVDPAGQLFFAGDMQLNALHTFPVATPVASIATTSPNSSGVARQPVSLSVDPLGRFVYVSSNIDATLSVFTPNRSFSNVAAGAVVALGISPPRFPRTILVDPSGQFAYVADETSGKVMAFRINQTTGALTFIADFAVTATGHPFALAIARQPL